MTGELGNHHLRAWRLYRGLTIGPCAEHAGIHRTQLGRIELGEQPYSERVVVRLAALYQCSPGDLLDRVPPKKVR